MLIIAPEPEAKKRYLFPIFFNMKVYRVFSLEWPQSVGAVKICLERPDT